MTKGTGITALLALFLLAVSAGAQSVSEDIQTLNEEASPGAKMAAARRLGRERKNDQWPSIIAALTRQSGMGDNPVREAAQEALINLMGRDNAGQLVAGIGRLPEAVGPKGIPASVDAIAAAGIAESRGPLSVEPLLSDFANPADVYQTFRQLEQSSMDSHGMHELLVEAREGTPPGKKRAEWALWCLLGPEESQWAIRIGRAAHGDTFVEHAKSKWISRLSDWTDAPLAIRLVRSSWPELRDLGEAALNRMTELTANDASPEIGEWRKRAASAFKPILIAREKREMTEIARYIKNRWFEYDMTRIALARYDSPNKELRGLARSYIEVITDDKSGKVNGAAAAHLTEMLLDPKQGNRDRILEILDRTTELSRATVVSRVAVDLIEGSKQADQLVARWKLENAPQIRFAREIKNAHDAHTIRWNLQRQSPIREWLRMPLSITAYQPEILGRLLTSDDAEVSQWVAHGVMAAPDEFQVIQAVRSAIKEGRRPTPAILAELKNCAPAIALALQDCLKSQFDYERNSALHTLAFLGAAPPLAADLEKLLHSKDREERNLAAQALGTDAAYRLARGPDILKDLRSPDPRIRSAASHEAKRLALDTPEVMGALVRAVDTGNMPVREGLTLALERAWAAHQTVMQILAAADTETDPTARAYLRAAKRAVGR